MTTMSLKSGHKVITVSNHYPNQQITAQIKGWVCMLPWHATPFHRRSCASPNKPPLGALGEFDLTSNWHWVTCSLESFLNLLNSVFLHNFHLFWNCNSTAVVVWNKVKASAESCHFCSFPVINLSSQIANDYRCVMALQIMRKWHQTKKRFSQQTIHKDNNQWTRMWLIVGSYRATYPKQVCSSNVYL